MHIHILIFTNHTQISIFFYNRQLTGDYAGLVRMADLAHLYSGAYPAWTGPADAQLVAVKSETARVVLAGAGISISQ
ncbi:hypothetical protein DPMN_093516 [Dreissena polymorpha]|uniref:Uncharacterized protein n=1 Tax=Dreissena polymorpha TaxID=45954 RepID=A0A9D4R128_DREPO|nr:hypothetical protein DPMN_093516 [Dreissena polymorpha]